MDRSCGESNNSSSSNGGGANKEQFLMHLNKISHKISKPPIRNHLLPQQPPPEPQPQRQHDLQHQHQHQHQPPVYNINKSDFREVVQKLTGSPAHERFSTPPPIHPPKPPSSRLQRIRPPPLVQLTNRPPPLLNNAAPSQTPLLPNDPLNPSSTASVVAAGIGTTTGNFVTSQRQFQPLSPLPPFPAVHAAAESPISAYMRYLQSSTSTIDSDSKRSSGFSPLAPRWNNFADPRPLPHEQQSMPPPQQQDKLPSPTSANRAPIQFPSVSSPGPFGCMQSPKSSFPLLSPSLLLSPTNQFGFQNFPLSPTLSVPSPTWKGH